jgi:hypothetical protein
MLKGGGRFQPPGWGRPNDVAVNDVYAGEGRLGLG